MQAVLQLVALDRRGEKYRFTRVIEAKKSSERDWDCPEKTIFMVHQYKGEAYQLVSGVDQELIR